MGKQIDIISGVGASEGLDRFVTAQDGVWEIVLPELRAGEKRGHWMWFIFPQIIGLGSSSMSTRYAIRDLAEARAYLAHPVLGARLREAMSVVLTHRGRKTAREIFSSIDAMKLRSSATLFNVVSPGGVFQDILDAFYSGSPCEKTLAILGQADVKQKANGMIGAIVGDIAGSRFEWHNRKSKRFTFMKGKDESRHPCQFTDDSVMTLAVAYAIMRWRESGGGSYDALSARAVTSMQEFGRRYPDAGYGGAFKRWLDEANPQPYNSWGNGAAMRVSACGWAGQTLDEVKAMSRAVTVVTHNHPEGLKGAEATAVATFLAKIGTPMDEIKNVIVRDYYPLDFTLDEIRPTYKFDVSCQGSVPQALKAFFESTSFEDAIRNAISIGGDSDTIGAICGAVAGAYYGVPDDIRAKAETFLDEHLLKTLHDFELGAVKKVCQISPREAKFHLSILWRLWQHIVSRR